MLQPIFMRTRKITKADEGDEEIEETCKHRCHGEDFFGEIDFDDEVTIASETVAGEADAGDDEGPRDRLNGHAGDIRRFQRRMSDHGIGVAHHNAGHDNENGHKDGPEESHDRLLIPDLDVAVGDHVQKLSIFVQLFAVLLSYLSASPVACLPVRASFDVCSTSDEMRTKGPIRLNECQFHCGMWRHAADSIPESLRDQIGKRRT